MLVLLALFGIAISWYWEPPRIRYERWTLTWTITALLVFIYETLSILAGSEILLAGAEFLVSLLLVKLFNRQHSKDYLHLYLLSFLLLTAGTVLNAEVTYGFFFLCYVVTFTWAMIIFHLRRELEDNYLLGRGDASEEELARVARVMNSKRIVGRKFFVGTSLVSLTVFLSALGLFLLFPRIGFGLFFDKGRGGITMAGFSDGVQLGGHGLIKKDTTVVMRAQVPPKYQGRGAPYLHWRGVAFDTYTKGQWRRTRAAPQTNRSIALGPRTTQHHLLYDQPRLKGDVLDSRLAVALKQDIYLDPVGYDVLFAASMPLAFEFETKFKSETRAGQNDELRQAHTAGIKYTVYSNPTPPAPELLRQAKQALPQGYEVYLGLPEEIPECETAVTPVTIGDVDPLCRVRDLARWITRDATNQYDKARALEAWLRNNIDYTLQMESPGNTEPVEHFLFHRQAGHCEYFSSAMAVMARSLDIPVRNVNGFLGGEWNEYDNYIAVRAGDAHSWVEVYFPGQGWVTFDPTPSSEADMLGRGNGSLMDRMRRIADTIRFRWFKWVIEYDLYQQLKLFRSFGKSIKSGANQYFKTPLRQIGTWAKKHRAMVAGFVLLLGLGLAIVSYWRRSPSRDATSKFAKRRHTPVWRHYRATLQAFAKRGHQRDEATTPREFALDLHKLDVPGAELMAHLTELYYQDQYNGTCSSPDTIRRSEDLSTQIRRGLRKAKLRRSP